MKKYIALLTALLVAEGALAQQSPVEFHASGQAVMTRIKAAGEHFSPTLFQFKADAQLTDGFFDGVGFQGVVGVPISDDKKNNLTVDIKQQTAAYITFTSPNSEPNDLKFVLFVGYASTELESTLSSLNLEVKDKYAGTSYGFSLQQRIFANKPIYLTLDCARYYKKSDMKIDGCGLGATYAF
jgi:hypothetical protein